MNIIVIIVTYNGMRWYKRCFDSLRSSVIPVQTVVIDNYSTDNTIDFIKKNYPEVYLIKNRNNQGFGRANNLGIKYALEFGADYVFLLNQDAWIQPCTIVMLVTNMRLNNQYGLLSPIHIAGSGDKLEHNFIHYIESEMCPDFISDAILKTTPDSKIYPIAFVNAAAWMLSKDAIKTIGGFDPLFYHYGEDNNYVNRLHYHGFQIGLLTSAYITHDRPQTITKLSNSRKYTSYIVWLSDVNNTMLVNLRLFLFRSCVSIVNYILWFSFKDIISEIFIFIKVIIKLPQIIKHRKINKQKGLNYL